MLGEKKVAVSKALTKGSFQVPNTQPTRNQEDDEARATKQPAKRGRQCNIPNPFLYRLVMNIGIAFVNRKVANHHG